MSQFVNDTFTDTAGTTLASHTGETGATWTEYGETGGAVAISAAGRAYPSVAAPSAYYASGAPATAEYDVEADLYIAANPAGFCNTWLAARADSTNNNWYMAGYTANTGAFALQMFKRVAGSYTSLGSFSLTLSVGSTTHMKFSVRNSGTLQNLIVGGTSYITASDTAISAAGKAGVRFDTNDPADASHGYQLDNFTATDAVAGGILYTQLERGTRGLVRGVYGGSVG